MLGRWRAAAVAAIVLATGCAAKPPATGGDAPAPLVPPWLPAYSPKQQALLAPVDETITVPAQRVYPDLARFGYAANHPMTDLEEPLKLTKMIATVLKESPRFYSLGEAPAELANTVAQYGPENAAEPDGWAAVLRKRSGDAELSRVPVAADARAEFERGVRLLGEKKSAGAVEAFQKAVKVAPGAPAIRAELARALFASGKPAEAEGELRRGIALDATFAPFYVAAAEMAEARGDRPAARHAIAEALAYQPTSPRANEVAHRLGDAGLRVRPMAIFLDVDSVGAIHVGTGTGTPAQMYGGCRAVIRYEPQIRSLLYEQPPETPYHLSMTEEVTCLEVAIGAYLFERASDPRYEADPSLEALMALAHEEGLSGYAMFEILGQHRPERARLAPIQVHQSMVAYIEKHVLGEASAPEGLYNASLGSPRRRGAAVR